MGSLLDLTEGTLAQRLAKDVVADRDVVARSVLHSLHCCRSVRLFWSVSVAV